MTQFSALWELSRRRHHSSREGRKKSHFEGWDDYNFTFVEKDGWKKMENKTKEFVMTKDKENIHFYK